MGRGFFKFFQMRRKKSPFSENIRTHVDRALVFCLETESVYNQNRIQRKSCKLPFCAYEAILFGFNGENIPK